MKRYFKLLIFAIVALFAFTFKVNAASFTIISSVSSVNSGGNFTVKIRGGVVGSFNVSVSNGRASTSSIWKDENADAVFTVTAGSSGSTRVVVTAANVSDTKYATVTGSDDVTVYIKDSSTGDGSRSNSSSNDKTAANDKDASDNNYLKALNIENAKISPDFKKETLEYTIEVDENVEKVKVKVETEDDKAKVTGDGELDLTKETMYQIVVTAENGKARTYTLKFEFKDDNPIKVKKGNKTYTVVKRKSELKEFDDYKFKTISINGIEVPALYNKTTKITLVGLKYKGKVYLFRYDSKTNSYDRYIEYDFKNIKLVLYTPNKNMIPTGYKKYTIKINNHKVKVYKLRRSSNYSIIYGMNVKTGKKSLYLHDSKENTVQRYTNEAMASLKQKNDKYYKYLIIACGVIAFLIIVLLIVITKKDNKHNKINKIKEEFDEDYDEEVDDEEGFDE